MYTDLCGPSHPPSGLFRYLMVLINVSSIYMVSCVPIIISQLDVCKNVGTNNMLRAQFSSD